MGVSLLWHLEVPWSFIFAHTVFLALSEVEFMRSGMEGDMRRSCFLLI